MDPISHRDQPGNGHSRKERHAIVNAKRQLAGGHYRDPSSMYFTAASSWASTPRSRDL